MVADTIYDDIITENVRERKYQNETISMENCKSERDDDLAYSRNDQYENELRMMKNTKCLKLTKNDKSTRMISK